MKKVIVYFSLVLLIFSCTKNRIESCPTLPNSITNGTFIGFSYDFDTSFSSPCFNPTNPNEIGFIEVGPHYTLGASSLPTTKLVRFNTKTKKKNIILAASNYISGATQWSKNDWIFFRMQGDDGGFYVWKIKSSGDSLTQLTTWPKSGVPKLNKREDKIIYFIGDYLPRIAVVIDVNGNPLDTVSVEDCPSCMSYGSWKHDSLFVGGWPFKMMIMDIELDSSVIYQEIKASHSSGGGTIWLDNENVIWSNQDGVYRINIVTDESSLIRLNCESQMYAARDYSPSTDKVLLTKLYFKKTDLVKQLGVGSREIVMMNTDGTSEEIIKIDN